MEIPLPPELEAYIRERVASGRYHCATEVLQHALQLLRDWEAVNAARLESLRKEVAIGLEQANRGEVVEFNEQLLEKLKSKGRKRLAAQSKQSQPRQPDERKRSA